MRAVAISLIILNILLLTWAGMMAFHAANEGYNDGIGPAQTAGMPEPEPRKNPGWDIEIPLAALFITTAVMSSAIVGVVLYIARPRPGFPHDFRRYTRAMLYLLGLFIVPTWIVTAVWSITVSLSWAF